jgi:hypothetical protein
MINSRMIRFICLSATLLLIIVSCSPKGHKLVPAIIDLIQKNEFVKAYSTIDSLSKLNPKYLKGDTTASFLLSIANHNLYCKMSILISSYRASDIENDTEQVFLNKQALLIKSIDSCSSVVTGAYRDSINLLKQWLLSNGDTVLDRIRRYNQIDSGYNGVQWGASFEEICKIKGYTGPVPDSTNEIVSSDKMNAAIYKLLGASVRWDIGDRGFCMTYVVDNAPNAFRDINGDITYVFYKNKFAMAYSQLDANVIYNEYYKTLSNKYLFISRMTMNIFKGDEGSDEISADLFKSKNVNVFLITVKSARGGGSISEVGVFYCNATLYSEIAQGIKDLYQKHAQEQQRIADENKQNELNKLK